MASDPRALLDAYAAGVELLSDGRMSGEVKRETVAPKAIAALRAVLDELDSFDHVDLLAGPVHRLRDVITEALEKP